MPKLRETFLVQKRIEIRFCPDKNLRATNLSLFFFFSLFRKRHSYAYATLVKPNCLVFLPLRLFLLFVKPNSPPSFHNNKKDHLYGSPFCWRAARDTPTLTLRSPRPSKFARHMTDELRSHLFLHKPKTKNARGHPCVLYWRAARDSNS